MYNADPSEPGLQGSKQVHPDIWVEEAERCPLVPSLPLHSSYDEASNEDYIDGNPAGMGLSGEGKGTDGKGVEEERSSDYKSAEMFEGGSGSDACG